MKKLITLFLTVILNTQFVNAHSGDTVYANYGIAPVIDGIINTAEWSAAGTTRFPNSTDSVTAYFMHNGSYLFIALNIPDNTNNSFDDCGFNIDGLHNGGSSCQSDDFLFRINRAGTDKREGQGPSMMPGNTPTGWITAVSNVTGGWQAEYRFDFTKFSIPSTQYTIGLFIHTWNDAVGSDLDNWPGGDIYFQPNIWGDIIISAAVNTPPATPGAISGNAAVCSGSSNTYSITSVTGATSYTWTLPSGWTGSSTTTSITAAASSTSGNISVTANNSYGSSSAQTIAVTVNTINTSVSVLGASLTADAAGATYQWIDCNNGNTPISEQINQSYTAIVNGNYAVIVSQNSCSDTSSCYNINSIGIFENSSIFNIDIFPNPSIGKFILEMNGDKQQGVSLEIYNVFGEKVFQSEITNPKSKINLALSRGIYFYQVRNQQQVIGNEKLIIQ